MSNTLIKSASSWTAGCPGTSKLGASMPGISNREIPMPGTRVSAAPMTRLSKPGEPVAYFEKSVFEASAQRQRKSALWRRDERGLRGANLCDLRFEQRIQDDQGRSVLAEHLVEDESAPAPATAHVGVTFTGGVSGPFPWRRRPV
ncbi:hypothetical protein GWI34_21910 [Actinomadura sp. DSM 109109]|nr:hypothetical protein [Actinomadura lepetitiana]